MAAGSTYTPIATTTVSGTSTATVTFSSIAGTYTDLVLVASGTLIGSTQNLEMRLNSDSGTNFSRTTLSGTGSAANSGRTTSASQIRLDVYGYWGTTSPTTTIVQFMNYSNATTYKTFLARANNAGTGVDAEVGLWRSTSAITQIDLYPTVGTTEKFAAGSTFTLYGIAAA